ncbi:amino acid permease [Endozoicomonas atrinae]|uniref:amino acid permease n=1 Tax=Endozoicomonas atrinae TaxID=1333660 RepID=UPI003B00A83B
MSDSSVDSLESLKPMKDKELDQAAEVRWTSRDTGWMLSLFGTAIGAGVLYLPITAGSGGIWPLIIMSVLAGPMVWLAHRNLVRFCLSSSSQEGNITTTVREHFGERTGRILTLAYFLSVYPILLLYAIGITNVVISYLEHQLQIMPPDRGLLSLGLVSMLVLAMHTGEAWMLWAVKIMVYPLVFTLVAVSIYLIPQWNSAVFDQPVNLKDSLLVLFITTPLLIFSFNHSPACSAFAHAYRVRFSDAGTCHKKTGQILKRTTLLLLAVILLFVFSCVLSLTPQELLQAREENVPVLSVLAYRSDNTIFSIIAPVIAFLAIASSFFGVYLGALEGLQGFITQQWVRHNIHRPLPHTALHRGCILFILMTCWGAGYANWDVINMVEMLVVPVLATILYLMPVYALYRVKQLKHSRNLILDIFIILVGVVAITGFLVGKMNGM